MSVYILSLGYNFSSYTANSPWNAALNWGVSNVSFLLGAAQAPTLVPASGGNVSLNAACNMQFFVYNLGNDSTQPALTAPSSNPFPDNPAGTSQPNWIYFDPSSSAPFLSLQALQGAGLVYMGTQSSVALGQNSAVPYWAICAASTTTPIQLSLVNWGNQRSFDATFQINVQNSSSNLNFGVDPNMIVTP